MSFELACNYFVVLVAAGMCLQWQACACSGRHVLAVAGMCLQWQACACSSQNFSFVVKMATPGDQKCLLPTCSKSEQLNTFKLQAVNKLIESAVERHDCEIRDKLQGVLDSHGEQASVELHRSCYSLYTSKDHIKKQRGKPSR